VNTRLRAIGAPDGVERVQRQDMTTGGLRMRKNVPGILAGDVRAESAASSWTSAGDGATAARPQSSTCTRPLGRIAGEGARRRDLWGVSTRPDGTAW